MKDKAEIHDKVLDIVSGYSKIDPDQIDLEYVLQDPPLRLNRQDLVYLTISINELIEGYQVNEAIPDTFVNKMGLKVKDLIKKVIEIINQI